MKHRNKPQELSTDAEDTTGAPSGKATEEVARPAAAEADAEMLPVDIGSPVVDEPVVPSEHPAVAELAEVTDRYLRLAADYDNFRKRTARERNELVTRSQADLARRLLEALDDLGRVAHLDPAATAAADVIAGVELVERKVLRELGTAGLEPVASADVPFDPNIHEAIATVPAASEGEDHTVAAVFQVGYRFNGTLLRPARVQVRIWTAPTPA
jgi:molecular chaperone GrpE